MGNKSRDWDAIGKYISQMKSEGLSYKEGAERFGLKLSDIYEYNKRFKKSSFERRPGMVRNWSKIGECVSKIEALGLSYVEGAERFGVSVSSIYKYNSQIKKKIQSAPGNGVQSPASGSIEKARTGISPSSKDSAAVEPDTVSSGIENSVSDSSGTVNLPAGVADLIIAHRREHPDHGYKRIEEHLKNRYFVVVPRKKIRELLKAHGLTGTDSSFDKLQLEQRAKGIRRFEASYPRELYQMDISYVYLVNQTVCYLVVVLDDHSRFCVCCELRRDYRCISMIEVLHRGVERYGPPRKLLTDQGSSFYSWSPNQTLFSRYLDDMKIEHIVADPHSPQTLGKVERFHQTIQRELLNKSHFVSYEEARQSIMDYMHHYNYERPHQGIGGACPASRFHGIIAETSRLESELCSGGIDFSRGYLVFKMYEHTISIVCNGGGLQIFFDGDLLVRDPGGKRCSDGSNAE